MVVFSVMDADAPLSIFDAEVRALSDGVERSVRPILVHDTGAEVTLFTDSTVLFTYVRDLPFGATSAPWETDISDADLAEILVWEMVSSCSGIDENELVDYSGIPDLVDPEEEVVRMVTVERQEDPVLLPASALNTLG